MKAFKLNTLAIAFLATGLVACGADKAPSQTQTAPQAVVQAAATSSITKMAFGSLPNGEAVDLYTLKNSQGTELNIMTFGGIITSLKTKDKNGQLGDIVLGYDNLADYVKGTPYFGALIGRYGNRIGLGKFSLNGTEYQLDVNDGKNHLHGGSMGFDKLNWKAEQFQEGENVGLKMSLFSADGDQGYPGNLNVQVVYTLTPENELIMDYTATTDKATPVNLTQHSYFNLSANDTILGHHLTIPSSNITPVDSTLIPTGELQAVEGTPFDFRTAKTIGLNINDENEQLKFGLGYDHNFVLDKKVENGFELAATLSEPISGRVLEIWSTEPAIQFYSGNFLDGTLKGKGKTYEHRTGLCLEPQHYPDSPNKANFPSTILQPGETYHTTMSYRFKTL